jgi:uncharacterized heparinase superfamily protein
MTEQQNEAVRGAGDALEAALLKATQTVERELARIVKAGEDDLDRLALRIAETLAQLAIDGVLGEPRSRTAADDAPTSLNQIAGMLAQAARRGARFT